MSIWAALCDMCDMFTLFKVYRLSLFLSTGQLQLVMKIFGKEMKQKQWPFPDTANHLVSILLEFGVHKMSNGKTM